MDGADEDAAAAANPFDALLSATHDDPTAIEAAYALHRSTRAAQQRVLLLSPDFPGLAIDPIFQRIVAEEKGFKDDRGGIVLAAKPPPRIQHLVARIQDRLEGVLRGQWFAPPSYLHLTLLEVTHSTLPPALSFLLTSPLLLRTLSLLTSHPSTLPSTLHSPQLNLDSTALSLSFLPLPSTSSHVTYHHLRQSLFSLYTTSQVSPPLNARYVVPSIHITLVRFLVPLGADEIERLVGEVERTTEWLRGLGEEETRWEVGKEGVVEVRKGAVWYGGGEVVASTTPTVGEATVE